MSAEQVGIEGVTQAVEHIAHHLPGQAPLPLFVHHNTLHGFEHLGFERAVAEAGRRNGAKGFYTPARFRALVAEGRIGVDDLDAALDERADLRPDEAIEGWPGLTRRAVLRAALTVDLDPPPTPPGPARTLRDAWLRLTGDDCDRVVDAVMVRLAAAQTDEGVAEWRGAAAVDLWPALRLDGGARQRLAAQGAAVEGLDELPGEPAAAIEALREAMGVAAGELEPWLEATAQRLPGWAGMAAWRGARPDYAGPAPVTLAGWLAARLAAEWAVVTAWSRSAGLPPRVDALRAWVEAHPAAAAARSALFAGRLAGGEAHRAWALVERRVGADDPGWARVAAPVEGDTEAGLRARLAGALGVEAAAVEAAAVEARGEPLMAVLRGFLPHDRGRVWLAAYEGAYRDRVLSGVEAAARRGERTPNGRPSAQVVFCIDDREEGIRRHLEERSPSVETLGAAGFFGLAMRYRGLSDHEAVPLCPLAIDPVHLVTEAARGGAAPTPGLVDRIAARLGVRRPPAVATRLVFQAEAVDPDRSPSAPQRGFTDEEQVERIAALLHTMGLTRGFARLVVLMGHGAWTRNNPHYAAYDCGACSGRHGGPNGRLFAAISNRPVVREGLRARGIEIPDDVVFVGAEHDTCGEGIEWFDLEDVPASHRAELDRLRAQIDEAGAWSAHERCRKFEHAPVGIGPAAALRHVQRRGTAFSQARPELGHATNALCIVGRRALNRGLFLDRRVFLVSYDPADDPDGVVLEGLLASVGPVGAGINLEYYFSAVDPVRYGCDTKVAHNLCGLVGVMEGAESDLRTGLPAQMTEVHEAMRLLLIVEASRAVLGRIHGAQPGVRQLVDGGWLHLVALEADGALYRFRPGVGFVPWSGPHHPVPVRRHSSAWYGEGAEPLPPALIDPVEAHHG